MESSFSILVIMTIVIIIFINIVIIIIIIFIVCSSWAVLVCRVEAALWKPQELSSPSRGTAEAERSRAGGKNTSGLFTRSGRAALASRTRARPHQAHQGLHTQPQTQSQVITCSQVLWFCSMGISISIDTISRGRLCVWEMEAYITSSETWLLPRQRRGGEGERDLWEENTWCH